MKDILIGSFFSVGVYVCMCPHSCHMHGRLVGELNNPLLCTLFQESLFIILIL